MLTTDPKLYTPHTNAKSSIHNTTTKRTSHTSSKHHNMELWLTKHYHPRHKSIINKNPQPAIVAIQETKLTTLKSTKYLQRIFPTYKMILNNTSIQTRYNRIVGQPYNNPKGGLLTLIHQNYTFPRNISKIPISIDISPYLQINKIANHPLTTHYLLYTYMPIHADDMPYIQTIQNTIFNHIHNNPNNTYILLRDFNRDFTLIGRQNGHIRTNPTQQDIQW
jgi:hypothetical protein